MCVDPEIFLFILYMALIGAGIGCVTGMIPGIHVNTLAALMLASYAALETFLSGFVPMQDAAVCIAACIVSASTVHSFVDYVPSVFVGAPDPDDVVSMLPGHRLLSEGKGMTAVRSAAIGSCIGACASIALAIPMQLVLSFGLGDYLDSITAMVLTSVIMLMLFHEKDPRNVLWAIALLMLSGLLGLACMDLRIPCSGIIPEGTLLFPLLTGLFGMPAMIQSTGNASAVTQTDEDRYPVGPIPGLKGVITGYLTGWFPGITATTGAVISNTVTPEKGPEGFIAMTASIGTSASVMMIITLSITGNGRSGAMIAVGEILGDSIVGVMNEYFLMLLFAAAVASVLGYHLTIACGRLMSAIVSRTDMSSVNRICIALIVILVILMTGPWGLVILVLSTLVGFVPVRMNIGRIYLTGCLLIPTLMTHLGIRDAVLSFLCG